VHDIADGPQYRLHKGLQMSLESCKWVQPFPRARERLAPHPLQYGQCGQWSNWPDEARFHGGKIPAARQAAGICIAGTFDQ
jgi:hypothetical protein